MSSVQEGISVLPNLLMKMLPHLLRTQTMSCHRSDSDFLKISFLLAEIYGSLLSHFFATPPKRRVLDSG
jgi:hypothetical protein